MALLFFLPFNALALTHSPLRSVTGPEWGEPTFNSSIREECGAKSYNAGTGEVCGVAAYKTGTDTKVCGNETVCTFKPCRGPRGGFCAEPIERCKDVPATCSNIAFGVATYKSCENPAFGAREFNSCPDRKHPIYPTLLIRKTSSETESYIANVQSQIENYSIMFATNLASLLSKVADKVSTSCLLDTYEARPQFKAMVVDLILKFETSFGEVYQPQKYAADCSSKAELPADIQYGELKCSTLSSQSVLSQTGIAGVEAGLQNFYIKCLYQKGYEAPKEWFQFQLDEIDLLLNDFAAKDNAAIKQELIDLKQNLYDANVIKKKD